MKTGYIFIILTLFVVNICALPTEKEERAVASKTKEIVERTKDSKSSDDYKHNKILRVEDDPKLTGGYFQGDMVIRKTYNGIASISNRWPNGVVYYKINPHMFTKKEEALILGAMNIIQTRSCVLFLPALDTTKGFIGFVNTYPGCYSVVGYIGREQILNLGTGCFQLGTIMHELLHALGFFHQHNVPERDNYVKIFTENIIPGKEESFEKLSDKLVNSFGVKYDYHSIMHYGEIIFSKNGKKTMIPLADSNIKIGQRYYISDGDAEKLNKMYNCESIQSKSVQRI